MYSGILTAISLGGLLQSTFTSTDSPIYFNKQLRRIRDENVKSKEIPSCVLRACADLLYTPLTAVY